MNNLIETSIKILGHGTRMNCVTIFDPPPRKKRIYHNILSASGKKVLILFSYEDENSTVKDVAIELEIPIMHNEIVLKDYIIAELKNILNNVNQ